MVIITDRGLEATARFIGGVSPPAPFTYMALGMGTTLAEDPTNTFLESECGAYGAQRAAAVCEFIAPSTIKWSCIFNFTGARPLTELGIFNSPTINAGNLFLRHTYPVINYVSGDTVEFIVTHNWTV